MINKFALPFTLAKRFISGKNENTFIGFIGKSSTIGIALGVSVLIIALSVMNGFERELVHRLLSIVPHTELVGVEQPVEDWQQKVELANQNSNVKGAAPVNKITGMVQKNGVLKAAEIRGVLPELEGTVSSVADFVVEGSFQSLEPNNLTDQRPIVLGQLIAESLDVTIGDSVELLVPPTRQADLGAIKAPKLYRFVVSGIYRVGGQIDASLGYVSLHHSQEILGYADNQVSGIRLAVNDVFNVSVTAREVGRSFNSYLYLLDWYRTQGHLYQDIKLVKVIMYIALTLVIAVACFNIVSTLVMMVKEKQSEIAILKTMGIKDQQVVACFMILGCINGLIGVCIGVIFGVLGTLNLNKFFALLESITGEKILKQDVYFIDFIPTQFELSDTIVVSVIALILSFLATIYPARIANRAEPAQVLGQ